MKSADFSVRRVALWTTLLMIALIFMVSASGRLLAYEDSYYRTLVAGATLVEDTGNGFSVNAFIEQPPDQVSRALSVDLKSLKNRVSAIGSILPYVDENGKRILWIKVRGLGRAEGVKLEVLSGMDDVFNNPKATFVKGSRREVARDLVTWKVNAEKETKKNSAPASQPSTQTSESQPVVPTIRLKGPMQEIINFNSTVLTVEIEFNSVSVAIQDKMKSGTHLLIKITPESRVPREGLPKGLDAPRMMIAKDLMRMFVNQFVRSFVESKKINLAALSKK